MACNYIAKGVTACSPSIYKLRGSRINLDIADNVTGGWRNGERLTSVKRNTTDPGGSDTTPRSCAGADGIGNKGVNVALME